MMPSIHDREIRRLAAPRNEIVLNISVQKLRKILIDQRKKISAKRRKISVSFCSMRLIKNLKQQSIGK